MSVWITTRQGLLASLAVAVAAGSQPADVPPVTCTIATDKAAPIAVAPSRQVHCGLDLGSNNVKLIVLSLEAGKPETTKEERQCRSRLGLGAQVFDQATKTAKALEPTHVTRLTTVIKEMQGICRRDGGQIVGAAATQWARDATNIARVKADVAAATAVSFDVFTPAQEGYYGYVSSTRRQSGKVVVDPGSNSFQLAFWIKGAPDVQSVSIPFGYVRAAAAHFANAEVADFGVARTRYTEFVKAELDRALGQLTPRSSLAALKRAVTSRTLDGDLVAMGQDAAIVLAADGSLEPAGGWITAPAEYDAWVKRAKPKADPAYGEITARFTPRQITDFIGGIAQADFQRLRTTPVREMYGEKALVVPVLLDVIARELGLVTVVLVPAEMPTGFILARAVR